MPKQKEITKSYKFKDFSESMEFVNKVAGVAEEASHHPDILIEYNKVTITLTTHDKGSKVTDKDKALAKKIDKITSKPTDKAKPKHEYLKVYGDGGSRGNPGPAASGFVVYDSNDKEVYKGGRYLGITTNNQAEYDSLYLALSKCRELGAKKVDVFMDSQLVVRQMKREYKVKNLDIKIVFDKIQSELTPKFDEISYTHVPRELNKVADSEVNKVLDSL
jgi:ribonuclease HI/pterin-4a-carbinolamine dehydratase